MSNPQSSIQHIAREANVELFRSSQGFSELEVTLSSLYSRFQDYVYRVASSQCEKQIELLVTTFPELLRLCTNRPDRSQRDWRMLSVAWSIFADEAIYTDEARKCIRMLRRIGFKPDGHFHDRLCRDGQVELFEDYIKVYEIDTTVSDGAASLLAYCAANIATLDGLSRLQIALNSASDVSAPTGFNGSPVLHDLFRNCSNEESAQTNLKAIEMFLARGARVDQVGFINGWAHRQGNRDGEWLPLLHQVYWNRYTGRCHPLIVSMAESICDEVQRDSEGRTAAEYLDELIQTKAPK